MQKGQKVRQKGHIDNFVPFRYNTFGDSNGKRKKGIIRFTMQLDLQSK